MYFCNKITNQCFIQSPGLGATSRGWREETQFNANIYVSAGIGGDVVLGDLP